MKTTRVKIAFARLPKDYAGLCRMLMPRPIHDRVDFENVTEITGLASFRKRQDLGEVKNPDAPGAAPCRPALAPSPGADKRFCLR